ncbi:Glutamyl-tRNA(Gln) amidotransferase subunit A-like protein [Cladobotryum mycophilum]|uniref:Glutamyl-tRNA(Gln) amidotransferase subunit A-like protein n=1 Tax=Cladobotryum mycophilum TaxID=491253 RepID=A0ABR0SXJ5_9HYPO
MGNDDAYRLSASAALAKIRNGELTVEGYARSLLRRIDLRDADVGAWAYLDKDYVLQQARALDKVPMSQRGPLHGMPLAVKDVIYTKDMPTQHNSPIYKNDFPKLDAASIIILRHAGVLLLEFAATTSGPSTRNPHDPSRTPGGSSSGTGAAVGDFQAPVGLGTQTGGSTIRPASFNGIYSMKPTWNAISREGQKVSSLMLDTLGLFSRSVDDLDLLADAFLLRDDEKSTFQGVKGARFALCKTSVWPAAGPGTRHALMRAADILRAHGAIVEELDLPAEFENVPNWHTVLLHTEGHTAFLPEHQTAKDKLASTLVNYVEGTGGYNHAAQLRALDNLAALRPKIDAIAGQYAAILTPSVIDEAPKGLHSTGDHAFCCTWSALHTPVINMPGFQGSNGMPIGVSLVAPRYHDRHLLKVAKEVGKIFEAEGGWKSKL